MTRFVRGVVPCLAALAVWLSSSQGVRGQEPPAGKGKGAAPAAARQKGRARPSAPDAKAAPAPGPEAPAAEPSDPSAGGSLVFSRDIAPILVANCTGCHNPKDRDNRGKLDLSTFEAILAGTPTEKVIVPGKPAESHLVLRIKGEETPRMPQGNDRRLSDEAIGRIERWVREGAILDAGRDPRAAIASYAASAEEIRKAELAKQSGEERQQRLEAVGRERYKKGDPRAEPELTTSAHFILLGTLPKERANAALRALENQYTLARSLVGPAPLDWGEKASVYVFNDAASYVEFVRALENRDVEASETGTARFGIPQPYVAAIDPLAGKPEPAGATSAARRAPRGKRDAGAAGDGPGRSLAGVISEPFVAGVVERAGKPPRWLSLGLGAHAASRVEPRSPYYQSLRREAYDLWRQGWTSKANDALGSATKASEIRAVGFAAVEFLTGRARPAFLPMTRGMLAGQEKLDEVLRDVLGASREQFLAALGEFVGGSYGGLR